jgi:hypothetical protein
MANKTVHALLLVLSDGSTYEVLPGATIVAVTEEGFDAVTGVSDAKVLRSEHIVGELDVAELIPEDFFES